MILNKGSKMVLKGILRSKPTVQGRWYDVNDVERPSKMDSAEFNETIIYLESVGAIRFQLGMKTVFSLTTEGKHYFEFKRIGFKEFFVKSIIVPIFVSAITTGVLHILERLLSN